MKAISYHFEDITFSKKTLPTKSSIIRFVVKGNLTINSICFVFCSDRYLQNLNEAHLSHADLTDVITFDYSKKKIISGDIIISIERVRENALIYKASFKEELFRVMIHGVLHLMGYNDKTSLEKKKMRNLENLYLKSIKNGLI